MADIKEQRLLYHLTHLDNIGSILSKGLMPRVALKGFVDVADAEILTRRQRLGLENAVPFHFFARNPFDGRVQVDHPGQRFALITVRRALAQARNWKIIPRHPLARVDLQAMDYGAGFAAIDWDAMNRRQYDDGYCKSVCMAECEAPGTVSPADFFMLFVRDATSFQVVQEQCLVCHRNVKVTINSNMFSP